MSSFTPIANGGTVWNEVQEGDYLFAFYQIPHVKNVLLIGWDLRLPFPSHIASAPMVQLPDFQESAAITAIAIEQGKESIRRLLAEDAQLLKQSRGDRGIPCAQPYNPYLKR